jgi:hypothetical protein
MSTQKQATLKRSQALKGKSYLLQQIEYGDFDTSDYYNQAQAQLKTCIKAQNALKKTWIAGPLSLRHRLDEIERRYNKKYVALMESHIKEEDKLLKSLRAALIKEFDKDLWYEALDTCGEADLKSFYLIYRELAK